MKSSSASSLMTLLFAVAFLSLGIGVAWSRGDEVPSHRIAVCDIHGIVDKLMKSKRFAPTKDAEKVRVDEWYNRTRQELTDLYDALGKMEKSDPEYERREAEYREKFQQMAKESESRQSEYVAFVIKLRHEAYKLATESAIAIAKQSGYAYLIGSSAPDQEFRLSSDQYDYGIQAARRPCLMWPDDADISAAVESDLGL